MRSILIALAVGLSLAVVSWAVPNPKFPWPDGSGGISAGVAFKGTSVFAIQDIGVNGITNECLTTRPIATQLGINCSALANIIGNADQLALPLPGELTVHEVNCTHGDVGTWSGDAELNIVVARVDFADNTVTNFGSYQIADAGGDVTLGTTNGVGYTIEIDATLTMNADDGLIMKMTSGVDTGGTAIFQAACSVEWTLVP
jgi:hypothetical protein